MVFVPPQQARWPSSIRPIVGGDVSRVPPYERPVNMMFQSYALFPHMTVADNVAYGLKVDGVHTAERDRRVARSTPLFGRRGERGA